MLAGYPAGRLAGVASGYLQELRVAGTLARRMTSWSGSVSGVNDTTGCTWLQLLHERGLMAVA